MYFHGLIALFFFCHWIKYCVWEIRLILNPLLPGVSFLWACTSALCFQLTIHKSITYQTLLDCKFQDDPASHSTPLITYLFYFSWHLALLVCMCVCVCVCVFIQFVFRVTLSPEDCHTHESKDMVSGTSSGPRTILVFRYSRNTSELWSKWKNKWLLNLSKCGKEWNFVLQSKEAQVLELLLM